MKGKFRESITKMLALILAIFIAIPSQIFAQGLKKQDSDKYDGQQSVMGIADGNKAGEDRSDNLKTLKSDTSISEADDYKLSKSATISKATGRLTYKIILEAKSPVEESLSENLLADFAIENGYELSDLKIEKVNGLDKEGNETEADFKEASPNILTSNPNIETLAISTNQPQNGLVYYLSAKVDEKTLANIEKTDPTFAIDMSFVKEDKTIVATDRYAVELAKEDESTDITINEKGEIIEDLKFDLVEAENPTMIKGEYKEESQGIFSKSPATIVWTDYILSSSDKELTYDFKIDDAQDANSSKIKIDFFEATDKGFVLNNSFSQELPYTNSLKLQVPQGQLARIELSTNVKNDTNPKVFTLNNKEIVNPTYKSESADKDSEEEDSSEDADPLPETSDKKADIEASEEVEKDTKQETTEKQAPQASAITLNKDAYLESLSDTKDATKITKATNQIAFVLESYNNEEIEWNDFKRSVQTIAKAQNIDQAQTEDILTSLTAGLNEDKYKVANIDIEDATNFYEPTYSKDSEESQKLTTEEGAVLEISDFDQTAQKAAAPNSYTTSYPYSIEYDVKTSVRDGNGNPITSVIPSAGQNPEVWWDIELDTSKVKNPNLNYDNLYYTLYMGAKDGLDNFKYKVSTNPIAEDDNSGFRTADTRSEFLYQGYDNIRKKDLGDKLYIRVKASIDDDSEVHDQYSLGIRINPDKNYINNLLNEFLAKYKSIPTPFKWKVGDGQADIYRDRPFNLLDERIVASPNFIKYDIDDNFYFDSTRSITADRRSDTRVEWNVLDLLRLGEVEDPSIENASLNPEVKNRNKYYYRPNLTGGYNRYSNELDVKTKDGKFYPGTIVAYNFDRQDASPNTKYKLDVNLKEKENLFKVLLDNQMSDNKNLTNPVGGSVNAYTYKIPPAAIDDQYLAYNENPFAIMRINKTFEMVQCFNDGYSDPTSSGNDIIGLQRIEDPEAAFLYSMLAGNNTKYAKENFVSGAKYNKQNTSDHEALKDALERAYFYTNQVVEEKEKQTGQKIPRQVEAFLYQKMVHLLTNNKPLHQQYGVDTDVDPSVKNWTNINTTLTGNENDDYYKGTDNQKRQIPADERRVTGYDGNALDEAERLANEAKTLLENSYKNNDWDKTKADSVELVFYKHNNNRTIQNLITAKIRKPINAQKITVDGENLAGSEFTFTSRQTGESVTWTSKENNDDNPLFLKPGQYYVDETSAPEGYSELETFLIELEEVEVNPDHGPYPQHGLGDIRVNDGYEYKLSILDPSTREKNPDAVQKDGSGDPLVSIEDNTLNLNIKNESKLGDIDFTKVNKNGRQLDGATFTLTKITSESDLESVDMVDEKPVYQKASTGTDGKFTFASIPEGTYKLEETAAPTGYQAIEPLILIARKGENDEVTVEFKNKEIQSTKQIINQAPSIDLNFRKIKEKEEGEGIVPIDSGTGKFRLYATSTSDGSDYDRTVSPTATFIPADKENNTQALEVGEFRFTDIVAGEYTLVEEQAPVGFQKPDNPYWRVKVMEDEENPGQLTYEAYRLSDNKKIELEKILRGKDEEQGTTANIENAPRTTKLEFKKHDSSRRQLTGTELVGKDGKPVEFRLHEADYYGNKKDLDSEGRPITADADGVFSIDGLEYSAYYLLEEVNPPAGYTKAADTVLYVAAEAEVTTGEIKVIVRDLTANTITENGKLLTGIIDYKEGERRGELTVKKTGQSLIEGDNSTVGLRRAYFRLYHATSDFEYADKDFNSVDKDKSYYYQRVTSGIALTDKNNQPLPIVDLPADQGLATFENLKAGNYILEEYRGPAGYEKDPTPRHVTVDGQGKVTIKKEGKTTPEDLNEKGQYEIFNKDESGFRIPLRITKKDESGSPLSGAKFRAVKIIKGQDQEVKYYDEEFDAISAATGLAGDNYIRELTPGIYELTEYQTPRPEFAEASDYLEPLDKNGKPLKWYFEVKRNPKVDNPRAANYMIIDFAFSHTFKETDKFTEAGQDYNNNKWYGKTIYGTEPVNGEDGKVANEDFMKLIKLVPDDHRSNPARPDAPYKGINDLEVTNVKKTTDFDFIKADDYSRAIEGAEFKLRKLATNDKGEIQKEVLSREYKFAKDENGKDVYNQDATSNTNEGVIFKDIPEGKYRLEETKTPAGFEKLEKPIIVEFKISPTTGRWEQTTVTDEDNGITNDYYNNIISYKSDNKSISQVKNKKAYTKLEFTKVDQSGNVINTSAFKLEKLDKNGNVDKSFTPQERRNWNNPKFTFENLTKGKYKLTEINPTKYQRPNPSYFDVVEDEDTETGKLEIKLEEDDPNISFEKDDEGNPTNIKFTNFDKIDFEFTKIGDDNNPLYGAGFTLKKVLTEKPRQVDSSEEGQEVDNSKQIKYTESGEVAEESKELSDYSYYGRTRSYSDGNIKFTGLSQGVYELEETDIPYGYQRLNAQRKWIVIVEKNKDGNGLEVKYDKEYEKSYYQDDTSYNKNDDNVLNIGGKNNTLTNKSNTTDFSFEKVDRGGNVIKKDTKFTLIKLSHDPKDLDNISNIDTYIDYVNLREEDGTFNVKGLDRGVYILSETEAPEGYKLSDRDVVLQLIEGDDGNLVINSYEADISTNDDGKVTYTLVTDNFKYLDNKESEIKIANDEIPNIAFNKVSNALLSDYKNIESGILEISISPYDNTTGVDKAKSQIISFNLAETKSINKIYIEDTYGNKKLEDRTYLIKETKAPEGYVMSNRSYLVEITTATGEDGKVTAKLLEVQDASGNAITNESGNKVTDTGIQIPVDGLEITETDGNSDFKVVNKKPTYPMTGGNGPKIVFAVLGTAVMLAGIAYYGIYMNNKNRRRYDR